jgi:hypothetical protein
VFTNFVSTPFPVGARLAREGILKFNKNPGIYPTMRNASINACLRMLERPGIFFAVASFLKPSTVWVSREALLLRE